jgi:transcription antitermination factor NusG
MAEGEVPFYLPLIRRRLLMRGRKMTSHVPLFPGYFFLLGTREERLQALATKRVVNTLIVADQQALWHDLRQVRSLIATGAPITPEDRLAPGVLVEIRSGPLAGLRGTILRTASGRRFVVQVDFIQRGASVLLDDVHLTAVADGCN